MSGWRRNGVNGETTNDNVRLLYSDRKLFFGVTSYLAHGTVCVTNKGQ